MKKICDDFDAYFESFHQEVYRFFFVTTASSRAADSLTFEAFLRLGAAKDPAIGPEEAKALLFTSAIKLLNDYYQRRMRRPPKRKDLEESGIFFVLTDEIWALLRLPLKKRMALCIHHAGFSPEETRKMTGEKVPAGEDMTQLDDICLSTDGAEMILDRIYERFSERSVSVENSLHAIRMGFNRAAPYLALAVLVLFGIAVFVSLKMAG